MQRPHIAARQKFDEGPLHASGHISRSNRYDAIQNRCHLFITTQVLVIEGELLKDEQVAWIEIQRLL